MAEHGEKETAADEAASTRNRILDVALDLFTEKGFDATSLREISERLGFTKAALYYHFPSKEDILMALHMRLHEVGREGMRQFIAGPVNLETWETLLEDVLENMIRQRELFLMHERNRAVLERLHTKEHADDHEDMQARLQEILSDQALPLADRVRMAASFGAVFGVLFISGDMFAKERNEELTELVRNVVHGILATARTRK